MHGNVVPGSEDQIDHLVVGSAGVFAIDSEAWDKRIPVQTSSHKQLRPPWWSPRARRPVNAAITSTPASAIDLQQTRVCLLSALRSAGASPWATP